MELNYINKLMSEASSERFSGRKVVLGEGKPKCNIMLIGEAPGADEEEQGRPFVGKAGKNLMGFLNTAGLKREDVYLTNVVKIRPFKLSAKTGGKINRPPEREEINFFIPFLKMEIEAVNPNLIVTLGNVPLQAVTDDKKATIGEYHGKIICVGESRDFPMYHPAAIIYNRGLEDVYYKDIEKLVDNL